MHYNEDGVPCFSKEHAERCLKGRSDYKKIVPVSEQVKADLAEVVKQDFISTNGKGIPEGSKRHDVVNKYLSTCPTFPSIFTDIPNPPFPNLRPEIHSAERSVKLV